MRTLRELSLNPAVVRPDDRVAAALATMDREQQTAVAVMDGQEFCGILSLEAAVLSDARSPVSESMRGPGLRLSADDAVRTIAKAFIQERTDHAPVFDGEAFLGLLSSHLLLTEVSRSWDPLTGLSWQDRLREWGVEQLESGQEICLIFIDLDQFGLYNKEYGHTVGDEVLRAFTQQLQADLDDLRDVLVRYGGDEFMVGTQRSRPEAEELVRTWRPRAIRVGGVERAVTASIGISGGKRTQERSRQHFSATLDNLINLASRDCLANKTATVLLREKSGGDGVVAAMVDDQAGHVSVEASWRGQTSRAVVSILGGGLLRASASALLTALGAVVPGLAGEVEDIHVHVGLEGEKLVSVVGTISYQGQKSVVMGTAFLGRDPARSAAEATWNAVESILRTAGPSGKAARSQPISPA